MSTPETNVRICILLSVHQGRRGEEQLPIAAANGRYVNRLACCKPYTPLTSTASSTRTSR